LVSRKSVALAASNLPYNPAMDSNETHGKFADILALATPAQKAICTAKHPQITKMLRRAIAKSQTK